MDDTIRYAGVQDIPQLKELWHLCFGDEQPYIDFYYQQGFALNQTLVLQAGQTLACMLTLMPCQIKAGAQTFLLQYVYAVATHPSMRGKGFSTRLLEFAQKEATAAGVDYLFLTPASQSLFGYYGKRGYQTFFDKRVGKLSASDVVQSQTLLPKPLPPAQFYKVRTRFLQTLGPYLDWGEAGTLYRAKELLQTGAQILTFSDFSLQGLCACYNIEKTAYIKELLCAPGYEGACVKAVLAHLGCQEAVVFTHVGSTWRPGDFETKPYAMLCAAAKQTLPDMQVYMNLCLD